MRKLVTLVHVSLDGYAANLKGEMDWIKIDDEMFNFVGTITEAADTALYGRVTWDMMEAYWPTAASQPNATPHDHEHSAWYNQVEKVVVSKSLQGKVQDKTIFIANDIAAEITRLKQRPGKNILMIGSPSVVRLLMSHNLIDEYWLFMNPTILGEGISIFTNLKDKILLTSDTSRVYPCGVTALHLHK